MLLLPKNIVLIIIFIKYENNILEKYELQPGVYLDIMLKVIFSETVKNFVFCAVYRLAGK